MRFLNLYFLKLQDIGFRQKVKKIYWRLRSKVGLSNIIYIYIYIYIYIHTYIHIHIYDPEEGSQTPKIVDIKFVHLSQQ